jgi:hypothetical protein
MAQPSSSTLPLAVRRAPRPSPKPVAFPSLQLEAGALVDSAPRLSSTTPVQAGAELRIYFGGRHIGAVLGIGGLSPSIVSAGGVQARLQRIPFDVGARGVLRRGRFAGALELGLVVGVQMTEGVDVVAPASETRVELGIRMALRAEYWAHHRVAPFAALHGELIPKPYNLTLPGVGVVDTTPQFWLGGVLGLAFRAL